MKKLRNIFLVAAVLAFAACLCVAGVMDYRDRFTFVGELRFEKNSEQVEFSGLKLENLEILKEFTDPKMIDLRSTGLTCAEYEQVKSWFPEAKILWDIPFQGDYYPMDTEELTITSLAETDFAALEYFTGLKTIRAEECGDYLVLDALRQQRPDLELYYNIPVAGKDYTYSVETLELPGESVEELFDLLPLLPQLREVELKAPLAPVDRILALREAFPDITFSWHLELAGIPVDEFTETLDLTGIPMTVEEMDAVLPYLLNLTYVDMTDCGISNEEMDALNFRYENVKIVWTITLSGWYRVRTDTTTFMPIKDEYYPFGDDLHDLRYCHDIIALDIGHRLVTNCEWAAYMPHLKFLIIADTSITDLTPLTGLQELVYLEMFLTGVKDFTPLTTLPALEDLNLCWTWGDPKVIAQIPTLKNCWWGYWEDIHLSYNSQAMLREALPDCNFCFVTRSSTGMGWRSLPNYFAQRDAFGMHYMRG